MAIPILNELNEEITRLHIAGSALAADDPRIKKFIPALDKLGEKVPVFKALAEKISALTAPKDEKNSAEALLDAATLLHGILYTQGSTGAEGAARAFAYADAPLRIARAPYSSLSELIRILTSGRQTYDELPKEVYAAGRHNDPRLYAAYCEAITDSHSYVSDFVEDTIIPDIGRDIAPFVAERIDLAGGKRNARLFKILYGLIGADILPTAERALAEGAPHVAVEAIRTLWHDKKYEETLLAYVNDRKSDVKQAALGALVRMGSERADETILKQLDRANISHLEEALCNTASEEIVRSMHETMTVLWPDYKKHAAKIAVLLRVFAYRDEERGLDLLEEVLRERASARASHLGSYGSLGLHDLHPILFEADTPRKNALVYEYALSSGIYHLHHKACIRLYSPAEVYKRLSKNDVRQVIANAYGLEFPHIRPDDEKNWDRRWADYLLDREQIADAAMMAYEDDTAVWSRILKKCVATYSTAYRQNSVNNVLHFLYSNIFAHAFKIDHPEAHYMYLLLLKAGFDKEKLDAAIREANPGILLR